MKRLLTILCVVLGLVGCRSSAVAQERRVAPVEAGRASRAAPPITKVPNEKVQPPVEPPLAEEPRGKREAESKFEPKEAAEVWKKLLEEKGVAEEIIKRVEDATKKVQSAVEDIKKKVSEKRTDEELEKLSDETRMEIVTQLSTIRDSVVQVRNGVVVQSATTVARLRGLLDRLRDSMTPEKIRATAEAIEAINSKAKAQERVLNVFIVEIEQKAAFVGRTVPQVFLDLIVQRHLEAQRAIDAFIESFTRSLRELDAILAAVEAPAA